jgi:hypothetical protein
LLIDAPRPRLPPPAEIYKNGKYIYDETQITSAAAQFNEYIITFIELNNVPLVGPNYISNIFLSTFFIFALSLHYITTSR